MASIGGTVVGRMEGRFPTSTLFIADHFELGGAVPTTALFEAFARAVSAALPAESGEILVTEPVAPPAWRAALEGLGFVAHRSKTCVRRDLGASLPEGTASLTLRSLADVGVATFLLRMVSASEGDPFELHRGAERDVEREWSELVEYAGERFDPGAWFVVDDDSGPVGVLLPQALTSEVGTLCYLGVEPGRRGRGLGAALHALGLRLLAQRGLRRYVGSTDDRNLRMLRTFTRNGCTVTERDVFLARPTLRDPDSAG
jgi:GNAT superfamily N-acetyltransferase